MFINNLWRTSCFNPTYDGDMGLQFGNVLGHIIEWKDEEIATSSIPWWERLPTSNLPFVMDQVDEPDGIDVKLAVHGRAFALVDAHRGSCEFANKVAVQCARRWESALTGNSSNTHRFSLWLRACDENTLREWYNAAIQKITFSTSAYPIGDPANLALQDIGDRLMSLLMKAKELSCSGEKFINQQYAMVFADVAPEEPFQKKFFSAKSNWFNSNGRYLIATTDSNSIKVEAMNMAGETAILPVQCIQC